MKVAHLLVVALIVASVLANEADTEVTVEEPRKAKPPRKGKKLVAPIVLPRRPLMKKSGVIIVPKGDPRAYGRAPGQNPFGEKSRRIAPWMGRRPSAISPIPGAPIMAGPVLKSGNPSCDALGGTCATTCPNGKFVPGHCSGSPICCVPNKPSQPTQPTQPTQPSQPTANCPVYGSVTPFPKTGNGGVVYQVVPIDRSQLVDPSKFGLSDTEADNTIRKDPTGCAFARMAAAAAADGIQLKIASGFRTLARQQYFWNCYQTKRCNGGNLAARPGTSNHGTGIAVDLNTDCGGQTGSVAPSACRSSKVYVWLLNNAPKFGFVRAVVKEPWHWEYHAGAANPSWAKIAGGLLKSSAPSRTGGVAPRRPAPKRPAPKPAQPASNSNCPYYANARTSQMTGNGGKAYTVVAILPQHLTSPGEADNHMLQATACAFGRMYDAAKKSGIILKISSGFRTLARQQYFWNCYKTKSCNNGNLAAVPGTSNHGTGIALDLNTGAMSSPTYRWLAANAKKFGFVRTVPSEDWHWEHRP